jgi:purine-nucleoside phosphorylase
VAPLVGIVLGSGLGDLADTVQSSVVIPFSDLPHHPQSTVAGHAGQLVVGLLESVPVAIWRGRAHFYEGRDMAELAFPIRLMRRLGARAAILTNAAGGLHPDFIPGDLMVLTDHLNLPGLVGHTPLRGVHDPELGERFVALSSAYDPDFVELALRVGDELGQPIRRGVYAMVGGPSYETPAEARLLRRLGADAVGMSTVPEVIAACQAGLRVVALSAITNLVAMTPYAPGAQHAEVLAVAEQIKPRFEAQIRGMLAGMRFLLDA